MQLNLIPDERENRLLTIHERLRHSYGQQGPFRLLDPVSQLVMGLIGGKTRGKISEAVFLRLRRRFPDWESLRDGCVQDIRRIISPVTFSDVKAVRLKAALRRVTWTQGKLCLSVLEPMPVPSALHWLERLPGVGRKTSASVLNFSTLRKPALVIDTHHLRILRRLGLVRRRATTVQAYDQMAGVMPEHWTAGDMDLHHQLMKRHGQRTCRHSAPLCAACCLADLCAHTARLRAELHSGARR